MFSNVPAWLGLGGAAALAGGLFLLQRLRVRPRVVVLPAAMLWKLAASQARPRALGGRFHDLPAYLLSLALVMALWFAATGLTASPTADTGRHVFYLDNSVLLTPGDQLAQAKRALLADVAGLPAAQREVVLGDAVGVRLLAPGEPIGLLDARLRSVRAGVRPSTFSSWTGESLTATSDAPVTLHYYGAWPAASAVAAHPATGVTLAWGYVAPALADNRGIVALGVRPASSGQWGRVDLLIGTVASQGAAPDPTAWTITLNGLPLEAASPQASGAGTWVLRDLVADGRTVRVALRQGDAFAADDAASLVLPLISRVAVAVGADVPASLREVVRRDPSLQIVDEAQAQVVVRGPGAAEDAGKPTLRLRPAKGQTSAFLVTTPDRVDAEDVQVDAAGLGLAGLDAGALADRLDRGIGIELARGPHREVSVWRELFNEDVGFTRSATMPLFVSRALRWLAAPPTWAASARAGQSLPLSRGRDELLIHTGPAPEAYLAEAGAMQVDGHSVAVSLLDVAQSLAVAQPVPADVARSSTEAGGSASWTRWTTELLLALATVLLLVEWRAYRRGRMP